MKEAKRMSAREGRAFINGTQVNSLMKLKASFTPEISKKRVVGQKGMTAKVIGYDITGTITQFKNNRWIRDSIKTYLKTGIFPKINIQAVMDDKDSDYFEKFGAERIQFLNVQIEGDLPLLDIDCEGEEVIEEISFSASTVRFI